jgi:glycosyltransferase involved in cell wall biosynthesis
LADCPDATLEVIGDGPDRASYESTAAGLPVVFRGACERAEVAERMHAADVLVLPSVVESFGIAALEGVAAGLPVVVTDVVPVADVILAHGGAIVPSRDPKALRDAIATAFARQALRPSEHDAPDLRSRFGPEAISIRWDSIYHRLVTSRRQNGRPDDKRIGG